MKKIYTTIILLLLINFSYSQDWVWSNSIKGQGDIIVKNTISDSNDNLYVYGYFVNSITFNNVTYTSAGDKDIFLAKISSSGTHDWIRFGSSNLRDIPKKMIIDNSDNIYLIGESKGDCVFNGNTNKDTVFNKGNFDVFLAKYTSLGELLFAKNIAWGSNLNKSGAIAVKNDNILISGVFKTDCIFGVDDANSTINDTITAASNKGIFVEKLDTSGNYLTNYHFVLPNATGDGNIFGIQIYNNNYYFLGIYTDNLQLQTSLISTTSGNYDLFLYSTDNNFTEQWVRKIYGNNWDYSYTLLTNQSGLNIGGYSISNDITFESSTPLTLTLSGSKYISFDCKYDYSGNLIYANSFLGAGNGESKIYSGNNKDGKILYAGTYSGELIIGDDTLNSTTNTDNDAYWFVKDDATNSPDFSVSLIGSNDDDGRSVYVDNSNNVYISGNFTSDNLIFPSIYGDNDTIQNSDPGNSDAFIAKYGCRTDISITYQQTPTTCPGGSNGKLLAIPSEVDSWAYTWDGQNATGETSSQVTNLVDSVWYYTTITSPKGCAYNDSIQMTHKPALQATLIDTLTVRCDNSNDGIAAVIPSNGNITGDTLTSDYHYLWSDGSTDSLRTDLGVGQYTVTVSDLCGDTSQVVDTINIGYLPKLQAYIQNQNVIVLCDTSTNGIGRVIYQDGVAPYSFQWENSNSDTSIARDLNVGLHHVTITDFCNQPIVDSVRIVNIPTIGAAIVESEVENATCSGMNNGKARVRVYNGVEPYNYAWSQSASDTSFANDLPGDSMVYVTVSDICHQIVDSVRIGVNPEMEITIDNIVNARCRTTNDGQAHISLNNEQGDITYAWSLSASDSANAVDLPGDTMVYVSVTDMCGTKTDSAHIGLNPALEISFTNVNSANCQNSADGQAMAIVENWQDTVAYLWENGDTLALSTSLNGGYQHITVTDLCGPVVDSVEIGVKPAMTIDATVQDNKCNSDSTGSVLLTTENAFGLIHYLWSNNDTTSNPDSLTAGTYFYTVVDACNDTIRDSIVVNQPTKLQDSVVVTNASDLNTADGSAILIASGGTGTYNYDWSNGNISADNLNLQIGTYYYTITDANNCTVSDSVIIDANEYDVVIYNTFTPNGDGVNDVWNIKNINYFPKATVKIYSQWGNQVFSSEEGYPKAWDGTNNGKELPAGTYYYIIKLDENTPDKSGYVTIVK